MQQWITAVIRADPSLQMLHSGAPLLGAPPPGCSLMENLFESTPFSFFLGFEG